MAMKPGLCPSCGAALAEGQVSCPACGSAIASAPPAARKARTRVRLALLLVGGLAVAAVIGAVVLLSGSSHPGGITFSPSTCSISSGEALTVTIRLPASVEGNEEVYEQWKGGGPVDQGKVSTRFEKQTDGTWLYVWNLGANPRIMPSQHCWSTHPGSYTLQVVDSQGNVLAEGSYTVTE